ncbi:hypothetical protein [Alysiella crassa]|nr:hypothetical protein [Alysiella crassa]UOP05833.1 hypothetical protein LVJ80_08000 [Alysiella crassa]
MWFECETVDWAAWYAAQRVFNAMNMMGNFWLFRLPERFNSPIHRVI